MMPPAPSLRLSGVSLAHLDRTARSIALHRPTAQSCSRRAPSSTGASSSGPTDPDRFNSFE